MESEIIRSYFPHLSEHQKIQIDRLHPLYTFWNRKINVISRKDIDRLYERHVLHSLAIAKFIRFRAGSRILDLGTGGGFPGIPLAIVFPQCRFHLIDAVGKKIRVAEEVARSLELTNLTAEHTGVERVKGTFDFIVARAVAKTKQLVAWTHHKVSPTQKNELKNGLILLKGGNLTEELKAFGESYTETALTNYFKEDFFETKKIVYVPK